MSGEPFLTMYGDLITEVTINGEVKVCGGPMLGGCSTSDKTGRGKSQVKAKGAGELASIIRLEGAITRIKKIS